MNATGIVSKDSFDVTGADPITITWKVDSSSPDGHRRFFSLTNENTGFLWPSDPTFGLEVFSNGTGNIFGHNASGNISYVSGLTFTNFTGSYTISATVSSAGYHFVSAELGLDESGAFDQPNGSFSDIFPDSSTYVSTYTQANNTNTAPLVVDRITVEAIPEPASLALLGMGGLMMVRRRK